MAWTLTTDAAELWHRTGAWLGEHAVENAPLLAEVGHLLATDVAPDGLECGWWTDDGGAVGGAYVRAPRHNPLLTRMPRAALDELARRVGRPPGMGVIGARMTRRQHQPASSSADGDLGMNFSLAGPENVIA